MGGQNVYCVEEIPSEKKSEYWRQKMETIFELSDPKLSKTYSRYEHRSQAHFYYELVMKKSPEPPLGT